MAESKYGLSTPILSLFAKTGIGIEDILTAVVERIPAPHGDLDEPLKVLLFDSWFDNYKGVICLIAIKNGRISKGDKITLAHNNLTYEVLDLGLMYPNETPMESLYAGQVGYLITGMKTVKEAKNAGVNDAWIQILE